MPPSKQWRDWVTYARSLRGAGDLPIRVRLVKLRTANGTCDKKATHYLIEINRELPDEWKYEVLLHELAHALSWDDSAEVDHNDCGNTDCLHFGCHYARLWRDNYGDADHRL
jgi:hypothetical protein